MRLKHFLKLTLLISLISNVFATDKVVLQLKWEHEFQFAGYYAAKWQGYYDDLGLEVEIRPSSRSDGSIIAPIEEVKNGNADFAIGALDILIGKDKGIDLIVLAPIFQRSPSAVFSLPSTPINNIEQLSKLRIAASNNDATKMEVEALFRSQGINLDKINFVDEPVDINTLINGKADAIVTYEISALIE